jgi:predicted N-acetyltransferase YhbS
MYQSFYSESPSTKEILLDKLKQADLSNSFILPHSLGETIGDVLFWPRPVRKRGFFVKLSGLLELSHGVKQKVDK